MANNKAFDTLTEYGISFQLKTLTLLVKEPLFLEQIHDILDPKFYDSDASKWIAEVVLEYFSNYKTIPTMEVFKLEMDKKILNDVMKKSIIDELKIIYQVHFNSPDLSYIKENFLLFVKNQEMKQALLDSVDLLSNGEYDKIRYRMDKALHAGEERNIGVIWKEQEYFQRRVEDTLRSAIETPWAVVNDITDGGLGKGELGVIVSPGGGGKSWALVAIANHAVIRKHKNVIYYTLELSDDYVGLRNDARLSGFDPQSVKLHQDEVKSKLHRVQGNLIIKYFPTKNATINTIRSHIVRCINLGFKPDMIVIDYPDLLRGNIHYAKAEKRFELENIYEETRGLAGEFEVAMWVASQANRSSLEDDIIEAGKIAESYNKIMIADLVMSLQRKTKDKQSQTGRFHLIKNRFGPDGITFPTRMDTANGNIELFLENDKRSDGIKTFEKKELSLKVKGMLGDKKDYSNIN